MKRILALSALALCIALPGPTDAGARNPGLYGIRPLGMGNAFVAVADDRNSLYYNPAGLGNIERLKISGIGFRGGIDNEFFDVIQFIQDNEEQFSDFDTIDQEFYDSLAQFDDKWVAADANAYVDVTRTNMGVGVYTAGRLQFKIDRGVYEPRVSASVADDIVGVVGGSVKIERYFLRVGGSVKAIWRRESTRTLTAREVADFNPEDILDDLEEVKGGMSLDLGMWWQRPDLPIAVGATMRDTPGVIGGESIASAFDLGTAWWPLSAPVGPIREIVVAMDLRNVFGDEGLGNKIHLGSEVRLPMVALRAGFNQGYPAVGVSLGGRVIAIDYAYYGRELGEFPGAEAQYLHAVEANLGF